MDVLTTLFAKAEQLGILKSLTPRDMGNMLSIYVDDVVLFSSSEENELAFVADVLYKFREASGLQANMNKSTLIPIRCMEQHACPDDQQLSALPTIFLPMSISWPPAIDPQTQ